MEISEASPAQCGLTDLLRQCHQLEPESGGLPPHIVNYDAVIEVVAIVEHHKKGAGLVQMVKRLRKHGWCSTAVESAHTGTAQVREGQGHGGVMVATRDHLHQRGLTAESKAGVQREEHAGLVTQWTARIVRARVPTCCSLLSTWRQGWGWRTRT